MNPTNHGPKGVGIAKESQDIREHWGPRRLSELGIQLTILTQVMILQVCEFKAHSGLLMRTVWSLFGILYPAPAPPIHAFSPIFFFKINK